MKTLCIVAGKTIADPTNTPSDTSDKPQTAPTATCGEATMLLHYCTTTRLKSPVGVLSRVHDAIAKRTAAKCASTELRPKNRMEKLTTIPFDKLFSPQ